MWWRFFRTAGSMGSTRSCRDGCVNSARCREARHNAAGPDLTFRLQRARNSGRAHWSALDDTLGRYPHGVSMDDVDHACRTAGCRNSHSGRVAGAPRPGETLYLSFESRLESRSTRAGTAKDGGLCQEIADEDSRDWLRDEAGELYSRRSRWPCGKRQG